MSFNGSHIYVWMTKYLNLVDFSDIIGTHLVYLTVKQWNIVRQKHILSFKIRILYSLHSKQTTSVPDDEDTVSVICVFRWVGH